MAQAPPCPYCGASSYQLREKRWLLCKACGHEFDLQRDLCPVCKHLNQAGAQACGNCGAPLKEDKVDRLITERSKGLLDWREERTRIGVAQKKEEEEASRRRMETYWADDRARREAAARARAEQREKEKKALIVVGIVAAIIVIVLVVVAILMSLSREPEAESATHALEFMLEFAQSPRSRGAHASALEDRIHLRAGISARMRGLEQSIAHFSMLQAICLLL